MMAINGKIQREGGVVHLVAQRMFDLTPDLASLGERDGFRLPSGRGDEFAHGSTGSPDSHERPPVGVKSRDIFIPDFHVDTLKVKSRNFQ
jgi:error-prone DNA polymerase